MPRLKIGTVSPLAAAESTIRITLPLGTIVSPIVDSATRNTRYASVELILLGAITVTFLPVDTMRGSRMKFLHVKPITQVMRSLSSVSGLKVTATCPVRFLQLYSASSSPGAGVAGVVDTVRSAVAGCADAMRADQLPVNGTSPARTAVTPVKTMVAISERRAFCMGPT